MLQAFSWPKKRVRVLYSLFLVILWGPARDMIFAKKKKKPHCDALDLEAKFAFEKIRELG